MAEEQQEAYDLIIIGAGLYGVQAARMYLTVHPQQKLTIFERSSSVGGVWSSERMYDSFWTQTPIDIAEFSDKQLSHRIPEKDQFYGFFSARHIANYLDEYVDDNKYDSRSLRSRIQFRTTVENLSKDKSGQWVVRVRKDDERSSSTSTYITPRIIDATGLTSRPNIPSIPGLSEFQGLKMHHLQFGSSEKALLSSTNPHKIVVLGGAKSAADIAYACAKANKNVTWVIRQTGGSGPCHFFSCPGPQGYRNSNESFYTRGMAFYICSIFTRMPGWLRWLMSTRIVTWYLKRFWAAVDVGVKAFGDYDREDGKANGFYNLKPDTPIFWQCDSSGVNQRPDMFDTIAHKIKVFREDITEVTETEVVLNNAHKTRIEADAILFATGWDNDYAYLTPHMQASLGLPISKNSPDLEQILPSQPEWQRLEAAKDKSILNQFPLLAEPPQNIPPYNTNYSLPHIDTGSLTEKQGLKPAKESLKTPYRLYNSILPLHDHSILFLGAVMVGNHFRTSEAQALWATAFFSGLIPSSSPSFPSTTVTKRKKNALPSTTEMVDEIATKVQWDKRRYLRKGESGNWFYYDPVPYCDMLLAQVGCRSHIREKGFKGLNRPAWAKDLRDCVYEVKDMVEASQA